CSAGFLFPYVDNPDVIVLAHINNNQRFPCSDVLNQIRPAHGQAGHDTPWCAFFTIFPQLRELRKYDKTRIFPDNIRAASKVVYLPRSTNLYGIDEAPPFNHGAVGLTFGDRANCVWSYGFYEPENWTHYKMVDGALLQHQGADCRCGTASHRGHAPWL